MLYILNTYKGIVNAYDARMAAWEYAQEHGGQVIYSESQVPKEDLEPQVEYVDGLDLYLKS